VTLVLQGIRRTEATHRQSGQRDAEAGADPLPIELLALLCKELLTTDSSVGSSTTTNIMTHAYLLLTWNLMCRTSTTAAIHVDSLSSQFSDHIGVNICKHKANQGACVVMTACARVCVALIRRVRQCRR